MATLVEREGRKSTCVKGGQAEKVYITSKYLCNFPAGRRSFRSDATDLPGGNRAAVSENYSSRGTLWQSRIRVGRGGCAVESQRIFRSEWIDVDEDAGPPDGFPEDFLVVRYGMA